MNPQRAREINQLLRTGEVFFAGEPARYAPFFLPRVAALALSGPRNHLALDQQVIEVLTQPRNARLEPTDIAGMGWEEPHHRNAGIPLLFGPYKRENSTEIDRWLKELDSIPLSDRPARAFAHIKHITSWLEHERSAEYLETLGIVSLEQFVMERLYGEISVSVGDGPLVKLFHTPNEFVATVLEHWRRGSSGGNVSHLRSCARIWLDLRDNKLPTPRGLHCLVSLITRDDAVVIYARLSATYRGVPTAKQIEDEVDRLIWLETGKKTKPKAMTPNQRLRWRIARLSEHVEKFPCEDPVLGALLRETFEEAKPVLAKKAEPRKPRNLPVFRRGEPCPFRFTEQLDEEGITIMRVEMNRLPDPMLQVARGEIPDLRKHPKEERWLVRETEDGGLQIAFALSPNHGRSTHQRGQAYSWAIKLCGLIQAPIPELPSTHHPP